MPRLRTAIFVAGALAVGACASSDGDADVAATTTRDTTTTTTVASDGAAPVETGAEPAPAVLDELDFVAPDVRGGQVVGADFAGQAMVIWFWAPW